MDTASLSASVSISPEEFVRAVGTPGAPLVLDVRRELRFAEGDRLAPGALRCAPEDIARFAASRPPADVIVYCVHGLEVGEQAAAALRAARWNARFLEGGIEGLVERNLPTLRKRPDLGVTGEHPSRWITRERPKIDRIACPWLIRRFIDPTARFFYVPTDQVFTEAKRLQAVAYDIPGAPVTHQGEACSFETLLAAFDLRDASLSALARIVNAADTGRAQLAPQAAGLLAISLGMSQLYSDDHAMLEAMMPVYDALYSWCRHAQGETHNWNLGSMGQAIPA